MANCGGCQYGNFPPPGMVPGVPTGGGRCNKGHGNFKSMWDPACEDFVQKGSGGTGGGCLIVLIGLGIFLMLGSGFTSDKSGIIMGAILIIIGIIIKKRMD